MATLKVLDFGPDKSMIIRGVAIIFMIILHNDGIGEFKICVPIFTFLVGYGYAFAKEKNIKHALKRSWHLLSHFWLILLGLFLPVAIWKGGYDPSIQDVLLNMFGLVSNLNWYSWYIYFYIFAMLIMIPVSRIIDRYNIKGGLLIILCFLCISFGIRMIPYWSQNIWYQSIFDCSYCSPVMISGYYLASTNFVSKLKIRNNLITIIGAILIAISIFFFRGLPYVGILDFITVSAFVLSLVVIFNNIDWILFVEALNKLGKESMNMWFFHAIFATTSTAVVFAPLLNWIQPHILQIIIMIAVSYFVSKIITQIYNILAK